MSNHLNNISIILVRPQLGENIGATARAMKNFGITDLRIISPRDGWPNPKADEMSAHAIDVIKNARIFDTLEDSLKDISYAVASTARDRYMVKDVTTPQKFAKKLLKNSKRSAILFGPEASGLTNEDISHCDEIVTIPVSKNYSSLNIAQSVCILSYEIFKNNDQDIKLKNKPEKNIYVNKNELNGLVKFLEKKLNEKGFFQEKNKKDKMTINLRNIFTKNNYTAQEISTLKGIFSLIK